MALLIGAIIGLVLGLTGAGGSVFAVPLLIILLGLPVTEAIGIALAAVAASAVYGSLLNWRANRILWPHALILGISGSLFSPLGTWLGEFFSPLLLLIGFNILALLIALRMWQQANKNPNLSKYIRSKTSNDDEEISISCQLNSGGLFEWRWPCVGSLATAGVLVGLLSGLFGVGGGFLIVPILIFLGRVAPQRAVATSLVVIACVSSAGFASYALTNTQLNLTLLSLVACGGLLGMICGHFVGAKIAGPQLQKIFSVGLVLVSLFSLADQLLLKI